MKYVTAAEHAELVGNPDAIHTAEELERVARLLVARAAALSLVLTVEQRSVLPLAMGRHQTDVLVRTARRCAPIPEDEPK